MFNYTNSMLAILEKANLISHEAASTLSKELGSAIHQHRYDDAVAMIEEIAGKVDNFVTEPWNTDIAKLERRIAELEQAAARKASPKVAKLKVG